MIITKDYKYNPLQEAIGDDIDRKLIAAMFEQIGAEGGIDEMLDPESEYSPYSADKIIKFIIRRVGFKILSVDLTYEEWDGNVYSVTYDDSITPERDTNVETILLELVANEI